MAKYSNTVEYQIRTKLDNSGITKLQAELTQLQNHITQMGAKELMPAKQVSDINKNKTNSNCFNSSF